MRVMISRLAFPKLFLTKEHYERLSGDRMDVSLADTFAKMEAGNSDGSGSMYVLKQKDPHKSLYGSGRGDGGFVLDFEGRVLEHSIKNIQLVQEISLLPDQVILQLGKLADHLFTLDCAYPVVPWLAFAIALTRFDPKHI
jgi:Tub family